MRYRIKIKTYKNGRKDFLPQKKVLFGWIPISYRGKASIFVPFACDTREEALKRIKKNWEGNAKVQTIDFEHVLRKGEKLI